MRRKEGGQEGEESSNSIKICTTYMYLSNSNSDGSYMERK